MPPYAIQHSALPCAYNRHDHASYHIRIRRFLNKSPDYASPCDSPSHRNSCPDNGISNHTPQYSWPQPAHSQEDPILLALIMCFPLDSNLKYLLAVCKAILTYEESTCKSIADVSHNLHILDLQSTFRRLAGSFRQRIFYPENLPSNPLFPKRLIRCLLSPVKA